MKLINWECLEEMDKLIEQWIKVDAIIADPPYGTTACKWDSVIDFDEMWERLNKLIKPNWAIVLFWSEPFSSALRMSNIKNYKYDWIWEKEQWANFMLMKYQPYKVHEIISVFSNKTHFYNPIKTEWKPYISWKWTSWNVTWNVIKIQTKNTWTRFPRSIQKFTTDKKNSQHPTQKPVTLMEYLIKTYTNKWETVLDFTMWSWTTWLACKNTWRDFIGIELDKDYFNICKQRIEWKQWKQ